MGAGVEPRFGMWTVVSATSATWTAGLPVMEANVTMAGGIATTAILQGMVIAMTATADLATVLRAGAGHRKGNGPPPGIRLTMGGNWLVPHCVNWRMK